MLPTVLAAVSVTGIGTVVTVAVALASVIAGVVYGAKWKIAHAVEEKARQAAQALADIHEQHAAVLQAQMDAALEKLGACQETIMEANRTIVRLEALPNLERVLELIGDTFLRVSHRLEETTREHEANAVRRHDELISRLPLDGRGR